MRGFVPRVVELHEDARVELDETFAWYPRRSVRAAEGFLREVERGLAMVGESPTLWHEFERGSRRYLLHRYPYALIDQQRGQRVVVLAVAHLKRRPGYWREREA